MKSWSMPLKLALFVPLFCAVGVCCTAGVTLRALGQGLLIVVDWLFQVMAIIDDPETGLKKRWNE